MNTKEWLFQISDTTRNGWWGRRAMKANYVAAAIYLVFAVLPLGWALHSSPRGASWTLTRLDWGWRIVAVLVGLIVSAGPPAWFWLEARAFDDWVNAKAPDPVLEKRLRETFKLNADGEKAFWAAIVAVYAAILLRW